jgi:hypothetical protein
MIDDMTGRHFAEKAQMDYFRYRQQLHGVT